MGLPPQFTAIARCRLEASTFFTPEHSTSRLGEHPKPLERSLERIGVLQSFKKKVSFKELAQSKDKTR